MSDVTIDPQAPRTAHPAAAAIPLKRIALFGLLALAIAVAVNFVLLTLVVNVLGVPEFGPLNPLTILGLTALAVVLATIVFAILARVSANPTRTFALVAGVALLLSFVPNVLTLAGVTSLQTGFGGGARNGRAAQAQTGAVAGADAQGGVTRPNNRGAGGANAPGGAPQGDPAQAAARRPGQGFGGSRVPIEVSLMGMNVAAFAVSTVVLRRAAATGVTSDSPKAA